ncbi:hypothetical protein GCM10009564_32500 [Streptomyces thermogriseus]|uniref:Uncharacterized protein n=1 Tax=Streptomyces thermogriseus TaxID=75292 RepID=A0ABN1T0P3_9ACTN
MVTGTPAGNPSNVATSAGPWDSPAVNQRNLLNGSPSFSLRLFAESGNGRCGPSRRPGTEKGGVARWSRRQAARAGR